MSKRLPKLIGKFSQLFDGVGVSNSNIDQGRALLVKILEELQSGSGAKERFLEYSDRSLKDPDVGFSHHDSPLQIIEFCMRRLQWSEVREQLERRLASERVRSRQDLFRRILNRAYLGDRDGAMIWDITSYDDTPPKSSGRTA